MRKTKGKYARKRKYDPDVAIRRICDCLSNGDQQALPSISEKSGLSLPTVRKYAKIAINLGILKSGILHSSKRHDIHIYWINPLYLPIYRSL